MDQAKYIGMKPEGRFKPDHYRCRKSRTFESGKKAAGIVCPPFISRGQVW
jgi:hypothetical protein